MWYFLYSIKLTDLIQCVNGRRETTMETEDLTFNNCSERQEVEEFCEYFPDIRVSVFAQAFIIKSVPMLTN